MDIGISAFQRRIHPAASQNHLIPPHLTVPLCAEKILLQGVKVELSEFLCIVHSQCFKVFDEQCCGLVRVQKVQNIVAVDHIDRIDFFLFYQPGVALEQRAVRVSNGVLFCIRIIAVAAVQDLQQTLIGGKGIGNTVHALGKPIQRFADVLCRITDGLNVRPVLHPDRTVKQQCDRKQHRQKRSQQCQKHLFAQGQVSAFHSAPPCAARYSTGLMP